MVNGFRCMVIVNSALNDLNIFFLCYHNFLWYKAKNIQTYKANSYPKWSAHKLESKEIQSRGEYIRNQKIWKADYTIMLHH